MKRVLGVLLAVVLTLALALPALAAIPTDVTVTAGQGEQPIIKCKWETPDDGDVTHSTLGTQILPPLAWEVNKTVGFFAVVTDPMGHANIAAVYADVYHPMVSPWCGSFKYQIELNKVTDIAAGLTMFNDAVTENLIDFNSANYTEADIIHQLEQELAHVYMLEYCEGLWYEQPAGDYRVVVKAINLQNISLTLENYMTYVGVSGVEVDFTEFTYGAVIPGVHKVVGGDMDFNVSKPKAGYDTGNGATVRNIGNTTAQVTISQADLKDISGIPLGKTGTDWNVEFDARLGVNGTWMVFPPEFEVTLPEVLPLSDWNKLDFSIEIFKYGTQGEWTGEITIGSVAYPFDSCP